MQPMTFNEVAGGPAIPPAARVQLLDDQAFEALVRAWMARLEHRYKGVERFGGPGDMGRDVIGWETDNKCLGPWDNVQCKHLKRALGPADLWPELGKVFWHADRGDYILPRYMRFLCSKGIGTGAKHLLTNLEKLRQGLIAHWKDNVEDKITDTGHVPLVGSLRTLVETAPFSVFGPMAIEDVLKDLEGTQFYVSTFGGGLPPRPANTTPPSLPLAHESRYVTQLFGVYAERRGGSSVDLTTLDQAPRDRRHFDVCRQQFYCAESLKEFARDATRPGTFEGLQQDVLSAITPVLYDDHENAFKLVNTALQTAAMMPSASNALYAVIDIRDKQGVCHQLVNDRNFDWIEE
jgi:hypothetical protein